MRMLWSLRRRFKCDCAIHAFRVLTGAQVRKEGDAEKYEAQVLVVAYQARAPPLTRTSPAVLQALVEPSCI